MIAGLVDACLDTGEERIAAILPEGPRIAYASVRAMAGPDGYIPGDARHVAAHCGQPITKVRSWLKQLRELKLVELVGPGSRRLLPVPLDHHLLRVGRRPGRSMPNPGRTALYRWRDAQDVLLYAGITNSLAARTDKHASAEQGDAVDWMQFAASATIEWFDTRASAERAEITAIRNELPVFNRTHADPDVHEKAVAAYLLAQEIAAIRGEVAH